MSLLLRRQSAAAQGDSDALCNLGIFYGDGKGVAQDSVEAARLFGLAAAQGDARAQLNLGLFHSEGGRRPRHHRAHSARDSGERVRVRLGLLHGLRRDAQAQDVRQLQGGALLRRGVRAAGVGRAR
jgi:TPR repeat protein